YGVDKITCQNGHGDLDLESRSSGPPAGRAIINPDARGARCTLVNKHIARPTAKLERKRGKVNRTAAWRPIRYRLIDYHTLLRLANPSGRGEEV
ncbi:MAG: hypothetical protein Q7U75_18355, partial [Desulfobacterales bacterium]|nr:hypothetical protein [Desulfobacterales bacterium]